MFFIPRLTLKIIKDKNTIATKKQVKYINPVTMPLYLTSLASFKAPMKIANILIQYKSIIFNLSDVTLK